MDALVVLGVLLAGLALGFLLARFRADAVVREARAQASGLRVALEAERSATAQREQLLIGNGDLAALVTPLRDSLRQVQAQLAEVERGRATSDTALREQVLAMSRTSEQLRGETAQLVTALRAPHVRGRWGEMQLERVVEAAGMTEHVDFVTQASVRGTDGTVRPDLVVRLTGGKQVVVDAKVAVHAYLDALSAEDEPARDACLRAHARQLRTHIDQLAAKEYWEHFAATPEFVVCFVPADAFLDAALRVQPALLEHAFERNVVLATPSTLVALLRTIAYTWRQEALADGAAQVHALGQELYKRIVTLGGHFDRLGKSLGNAVTAYNDAVGSVERRLLPTARALQELGVVDERARVASPLLLDGEATPRRLEAEEFTAVTALPGTLPNGARTGAPP
jgi:DNA recombination protein RmuC